MASRAAWIVEIVLIAALYVAGARLRLFFPFTEVGASWVWIPSGMALAALLLRGRDRWPGVALGALLSAAFTDWHWPSAFVASGYATGEVLLATALLRWGGPFDRTLQNVGTVLRFVASVSVSAAVTAIVGAWNLIVLTPGGGGRFGETWLTFWVGDAMAMLTVTPTLLVWAGSRVRFMGRWRARRVRGAAGVGLRRRDAGLRPADLARAHRAAGGLHELPADGLECISLRPARSDRRHGHRRDAGACGQRPWLRTLRVRAYTDRSSAGRRLHERGRRDRTHAGRAGPGTHAGAERAARE